MLKSVNKIIKVLVLGDAFLNSGWGLIAPVFAIYIIQNIKGGDIMVAGFAAAVYWIVKSIIQMPFAKYLDRNHGEKDDFYAVFFGLLLVSLVPLGYMVSTLPWHIYAFQILYAIGMALVVPAWFGLYTRHIDKGKEAYEWSVYSTSFGFIAGISGAIGGVIAAAIGFKIIFLLISFFTIMAATIFYSLRDEITAVHIHNTSVKAVDVPAEKLRF
ncbi:MAG: MFS transporter [bacterium]|nr:MFS transporter [bacterium]